MMWGWLNASTVEEARACAERYPPRRGRLVDDGVASVMDRLGPAWARARLERETGKSVLGFARRISGSLGV
jgi:hypothetical protein